MQQQPGHPPMVIVQGPPKNAYPINEKWVTLIGVSILVLGCSCIILQTTGIVIGIGLAAAAAGIWSGAWVSHS